MTGNAVRFVALLLAVSPAIAGAQECDPVATGPSASLAATAGAVDQATAQLVADARTATERTLTAVKSEIDSTRGQIAALEGSNAAKKQLADQLVAQIATRQTQVRQNYERTRTIGIIGALFGVPALAAMSVVQMYDQDAMLRQLNGQLATAKSDQARVAQTIADQTARKASLEAQLAKLRASAAALDAAPAAPPKVAAGLGALAAAKAQLDGRKALLGNLKAQLALLQQVRAGAESVGGALDAEIASLTASVAKAEKIVADSNKELFELVKAFVAPDPQAAAQRWLQSALAQRTEAVLAQLGLSEKAWVHQLVSNAFPQGGAASQLLEKQILQSLKGAGAPAATAADDGT